jgi:uncharacterized membrane protein
MISKAVRFVNLILAGLLAGNEFGTKVALHPALEELSTPERIRAEQAVTRRYGAIMPLWMSSTVASCAAAALPRGFRSSLPTLVGAACFAGMLLSTLLGNVPINKRTLEIDPDEDGEEFARLRKRWDRLHTLRVVLTVAGFGLLVAGALREAGR